MPQVTEVIGTLYNQYQKSTPRRLKLIDAYLGYILVTGVLQFVYGIAFGTFPFNAFLAGFISTVASFVLAEMDIYDEDNIDFDREFADDTDDKLPSTSAEGKLIYEDPEKNSGVVYLSTVPPFFSAKKIRDVFSNFGEVGRIFLQSEKQKGRRRRFIEGWIEFKRKSVAKKAVSRLNNQQVGGKRRTHAFDSLWCLKYLSGFKWSNLVEQLSFEKRVVEQRMRVEIVQAKKQAQHFIEQVERGESIKRLEEKVKKRGGTWKQEERRQVKQKGDKSKETKPKALNDTEQDSLLQMIFNKNTD